MSLFAVFVPRKKTQIFIECDQQIDTYINRILCFCFSYRDKLPIGKKKKTKKKKKTQKENHKKTQKNTKSLERIDASSKKLNEQLTQIILNGKQNHI